MEKAVGIETMNRPFPEGSALSAWFDKWIENLDAKKKLAKLPKKSLLKNLYTNLNRNTKRWNRLVKRLVALVLKLPAVVSDKLGIVAQEVRHQFAQSILLERNLNTQNI